MGASAAHRLLDAWEQGLSATPTRRALGLLGAVHPGIGTDPADLTLGERDLALLRLRRELVGEHVEAVGTCPACGAELDIAFDVSALLESLPGPGSGEVVVDGYAAVVRPPTSKDVLAVLDDGPVADAGARLLDRCVVQITGLPHDAPVPDAVAARLAEEVSRQDPGAQIELALDCAECAHRWAEVLDVVGFVSAEVDSWARRMLREVHTLARAYGWRESDILGLTPGRRAAYLQLVMT